MGALDSLFETVPKSTFERELDLAIGSCHHRLEDDKRNLTKAFDRQFRPPFKKYFQQMIAEETENAPELLIVNRSHIVDMVGVIPVKGFVICAAITEPYTRVEHELSIQDTEDRYLDSLLQDRRRYAESPKVDPATAFVFK